MSKEIAVGDTVLLTLKTDGYEKGQRCIVSEMMRGGYVYLSAEGTDVETTSFSAHVMDLELVEKAKA